MLSPKQVSSSRVLVVLAVAILAACDRPIQGTAESRAVRLGQTVRVETGGGAFSHLFRLEILEAGTYGMFLSDDRIVSATFYDPQRQPLATALGVQERKRRRESTPYLVLELEPGLHTIEVVTDLSALEAVIELSVKRMAAPGDSGSETAPAPGRYPAFDSSGYAGEPLPVDPEDSETAPRTEKEDPEKPDEEDLEP